MLFLLPSGASGKRFIEEMIRLVNSLTYKSDLKGIDDYARFITSKNLIEFKIKRKL